MKQSGRRDGGRYMEAARGSFGADGRALGGLRLV